MKTTLPPTATEPAADNTTDYKQAWKSAEQGRWLANEEIVELKAQRDAALAALRNLERNLREGSPVHHVKRMAMLDVAQAAIAAAEKGAQP